MTTESRGEGGRRIVGWELSYPEYTVKGERWEGAGVVRSGTSIVTSLPCVWDKDVS